jgi:serine phosphatase RsbU (regulator of sigma subunit)
MSVPVPQTAPAGQARTERTIVDQQPVGTLIVDRATVVTFANPAAARLLGVAPQRLVGEAFGLPVVAGELTDLNVPGEDGTVRTLAMRVTDLPHSDGERLVTLLDVTGRARVYEHEHRLVESLQRSVLLERMPSLPGTALAARYLPGEGDIGVGGDWYDAIPLPDGRLGLVIGDVAGHGIGSAVLMTQLRNTLRAYALEHDSPSAVLERLDRLIDHLEPAAMATLIYLIYDQRERRLDFAAAGHPYPLLVRDGAEPEFLNQGRSLPMGTGMADARSNSSVSLPEDSTLVLYTDGLIERRHQRSLDQGFARLAESVGDRLTDPDAACDSILDDLLGEEPPSDDVALLVMRT